MTIYQCSICSQEQPNLRELSKHANKHHSVSSQQYYDSFLRKDENEDRCRTCDSPTKWRGMGKGYAGFCSTSCLSKHAAKEMWKNMSEETRANIGKNSVGRKKGSKNRNKYPMSAAVLERNRLHPPPLSRWWLGRTHTEETKALMSERANKRIERDGLPKTYKGHFRPKNPQKYRGDPSNIVFRSLWELNVMRRFDERDDVLEWSSEEIIVQYFDPVKNKYRRYFPDFVAKMRLADGSIKTRMIEVKPKKETIEPVPQKRKTKGYIMEVTTWATNTAKWKYAREYCADRGWDFVILTEDHIFGKENK